MSINSFVTDYRLISDVQSKMNEELNAMLREKMPQEGLIQFFRMVIPTSTAPESVYPNKLEDLVTKSGMYTRASLPLATRLLISPLPSFA
jgi:hypothetical protein